MRLSSCQQKSSHTILAPQLTDGDTELGFAGVPAGWNAKPYAWMPGAISYHYIEKYVEYLETLSQKKLWVDQFKKIEPIGYGDDNFNEPPDDWYALDSEYRIEGTNAEY